MIISAYLRLMRFDKPVGIWLLWFPVAWALWLSNNGIPSLNIFLYFLLGTITMRAAGCVINDIADRNIDKHVTRTKMRPLTSGEITLHEAFIILFILIFMSFLILTKLPFSCFYYAIVAIVITFIYPFCKRYIKAPQLVLGVAFSVAIPMVYAASGISSDWTMLLVMCINLLWVVTYDTMYAMTDRQDDIKLGVKSTAVLFGSWDRIILAVLQLVFHSLWLVISIANNYTYWFYIFWSVGGVCLIYQHYLISSRNEKKCFDAFINNTWYGLSMWAALILNAYFIT